MQEFMKTVKNNVQDAIKQNHCLVSNSVLIATKLKYAFAISIHGVESAVQKFIEIGELNRGDLVLNLSK